MTDENYKYEINIVENGEVDPNTEKMLQLFRVPINTKLINYDFEPTQSGPHARMKAARMATGKYIIFIDAHTELGKNTIPKMIELLENDTADEVHGTTLKSHWTPFGGAHYKLFGNAGPCLNTHMHGSYSRAKDPKTPYPIMGGTLAYVAFRRREFLDSRGYHPGCMYYPHPEGYLPLKYLMLGKRVMCRPDCFHFHSNYPRNYGSKIKNEPVVINIKGDPYPLMGQDNLIRNAHLVAFTLGGDRWLNILTESWLTKVASRYVVEGIAADARVAATEEREWMEKNAVKTLDEVLIEGRRNRIAGLEDWPTNILGDDPLKSTTMTKVMGFLGVIS